MMAMLMLVIGYRLWSGRSHGDIVSLSQLFRRTTGAETNAEIKDDFAGVHYGRSHADATLQQ